AAIRTISTPSTRRCSRRSPKAFGPERARGDGFAAHQNNPWEGRNGRIMKLDSLKDLYVEQLRDLYNAEKQLAEALPKMAERATSAELKRALTTHLEETRQHADRLERIFQNLNGKPTGETCEAM